MFTPLCSLPKLRFTVLAAALVLALASALGATPHTPDASTAGQAPLAFEPNLGQTDEAVRFLARAADATVFATAEEVVLRLRADGETPVPALATGLIDPAPRPAPARHHVLRLRPVARPAGAAAPELTAEQPLASRSSYLHGDRRIADVPHYARVLYRGVYPGIDLVLRGDGGVLEYDFVLAPGADPQAIAFELDGASSLRLDARGALVLDTPLGPVTQSPPFVFQQIDGERRQVDAGFTLGAGGRIGFRVAAYDRSRELVIDPQVIFRTCIGGNGYNHGEDVVTTANGQAYLVGSTDAVDFPRPGGAQGNGPGVDAFIAKLDLAGNLSRATYIDLGTGGDEYANSVAIDDARNLFVAGSWHQVGEPWEVQAWAVKLPQLLDRLLYSRTFGGSGNDQATGIAVDAAGNAFVAGTTYSTDFCSAGILAGRCTHDASLGGERDAFLVRLNRHGSVRSARLVGGGDGEAATGVALDDNGRPYVAGFTFVGPAQPYLLFSWVWRLRAWDNAVEYNFEFGKQRMPGLTTGSLALDVAVDPLDNAYVVGYTNSDRLEVAHAAQPTFGGGLDGFVGMIDNAGRRFLYLTYLGGAEIERATGIAVGENRHAYVAGQRTPRAPDGTWLNHQRDLFAARYAAGGPKVFEMSIGGSAAEDSGGAALDSSRNLYIAGTTQSGDFTPGCGISTSAPAKGIVVKIAP